MAHLQLHLNTLRALHIFAPFASNSIQSCQAARNLSFSICHLIFLLCFVGWALQRHQLGLVFRVQCRTNLGFTKHCLVVFGSTNLKARLSTVWLPSVHRERLLLCWGMVKTIVSAYYRLFSLLLLLIFFFLFLIWQETFSPTEHNPFAGFEIWLWPIWAFSCVFSFVSNGS